MDTNEIYLAIAVSIVLVALILYGLFRSCRTGRLLLLGWYPRVVDRAENPVRYWCGYVFYILLMILVLFAVIRRFHQIPRY